MQKIVETDEIEILTVGETSIKVFNKDFQELLKWFYALSKAKVIADQDRRPQSMMMMKEKMLLIDEMSDTRNVKDLIN